jgi:Ca2+-binding EF-hand superfamily protein
MGQVLGRAVLRDEVLPFVNYQRESIYNLWESFNDVAEGFGINVDEFKEICSVLQASLGNIRKAALERICETLFDAVLDTDHNGLIDALEMLSAITIVSGLRRKDKLTHVFNLYDFDESAEVTIDEMTLLLKSTMSGLCKFCGIAPPDERRLEMMSQTAFSAIQKDKDNALTRDEFLDYCDRTPEVRAWLAHFDDAVDLCDDIKYQMDSDVDHEFDFFTGFEHGEKPFSAVLADEKNLASTEKGYRILQAEQVKKDRELITPIYFERRKITFHDNTRSIISCRLILTTNSIFPLIFSSISFSHFFILLCRRHAMMLLQPTILRLLIYLLILHQFVHGMVHWNILYLQIHLQLIVVSLMRMHCSLNGFMGLLQLVHVMLCSIQSLVI